MKLIIAGSRSFTNYPLLRDYMLDWLCEHSVSEVVCGMARGADLLGERWALEYGVPVKRFPADWNRYGKSAGVVRNIAMRDYADALAAFWDSRSTGTQHMIFVMQQQEKPVWVVNV